MESLDACTTRSLRIGPTAREAPPSFSFPVQRNGQGTGGGKKRDCGGLLASTAIPRAPQLMRYYYSVACIALAYAMGGYVTILTDRI